MSRDLTSDNIHLSRVKMRDFSGGSDAATFGKTSIDEHVASLVHDSIADNTRRAYLSDLRHFECWGGQVPTTDQLIALRHDNFGDVGLRAIQPLSHVFLTQSGLLSSLDQKRPKMIVRR
jgi:hypothetical protein